MKTGITSKSVAAILGLSLTCYGVADSAGPSTPQTDESTLMRYLQPALDAGTSVRFSYAATCDATSDFPPIPPIRLNASSKRLTGIDAVRSIFRSDYNVVVTEGSDGVAQVIVGKVPSDLLRTSVALLRLQPIEQYNPSKVLDALESTKELKGAVNSSDLLVVRPLGMLLVQQPEMGLPHVPATLRNVTIGQVLDLVSETFKVVVTYGVCVTGRTPRMLRISYISPVPPQ